MNNEEKIDMLINSRTKENNYLAMRLMVDVIKINFEKAFLKLNLSQKFRFFYMIEIADIQICYGLRLFNFLGLPVQWAEIERQIFFRKLLVHDSYKEIHLEDNSSVHLEENQLKMLYEIQSDLREISPVVKQLFYSMD